MKISGPGIYQCCGPWIRCLFDPCIRDGFGSLFDPGSVTEKKFGSGLGKIRNTVQNQIRTKIFWNPDLANVGSYLDRYPPTLICEGRPAPDGFRGSLRGTRGRRPHHSSHPGSEEGT
jgi:hypothetical protein